MAEAAREVVATYGNPDAARAAIAALERHGVDAARIRLLEGAGARSPKTGAAMRESDVALTHEVGGRGLGVAVVLALMAGAAAFLIVRFLLDGSMTASLGSAAGFFMAGGALGFFIGGASALSVAQEWSDTYQATGQTTIAVHVPDEQVVDLRETLASTHPTRITVA